MRGLCLFLVLAGCDDAATGTPPVDAGVADVAPGDARSTDAAPVADAAIMPEPPDMALQDWGAWDPPAARSADERLCPVDPAAVDDTTFIDCALDGARYAAEAPPVDALLVVAYNIERGFDADEQLDALMALGPDVLLISEADRGCRRTGFRHILDDYARRLEMDFVFATEFVELPRREGDVPCEHGNGILSRFPLGNVRALRHTTNDSWFGREDEPRLGGRVAVVADARIGARTVRFYSVHFESALTDTARAAQALEVASESVQSPHPVIVGGDMNTGLYISDLRRGLRPDEVQNRTVRAFFDRAFVDAHQGIEPEARITRPGGFPFVLDLIMGLGVAFEAPGIGEEATWRSLSDHYPVWTRVRLD